MTTIILVSIGVLLAAVAALFIYFYGGDAFTQNEIKANAGRLVSEGAQIEAATELYYRQEGEMPGDGTDGEQAIDDLIEKRYLTHIPIGVKSDNGAGSWKMEYGDDGMIYSRLGLQVDEASMAVCREARRQLKYTDTVPAGQPNAGKLMVYKCDGSDYMDASWRNAGTLPNREPCCVR